MPRAATGSGELMGKQPCRKRKTQSQMVKTIGLKCSLGCTGLGLLRISQRVLGTVIGYTFPTHNLWEFPKIGDPIVVP